MQNISFQLYSARNFQPFSDVFRLISQSGYKQVEGYDALYASLDDDSLAATRADLDRNGLAMPTAHFGIEMLENEVDRVLEIARILGVKAIYCPYLMPEQRPADADGWRAFGARLQLASAPYRNAGLDFGWHNHDFEFAALPDGSFPQDYIFAGGPDLSWEADIAWIARGGADPFTWIEKYADRITAVHVKDIAPAGDNADEDGWADVGHGTLPWRDLMAALAATKAEYFIVEHDNPKDLKRLAERSLASIRAWQPAAGKITHMTKELGVGIIGCGNISTTYFSLAPLFKGIRIVACADINMAAAEARAAEFKVEAQSIEALLANSAVDIVVNLTIPEAHFSVSRRILEVGKHVYSEKPLVLSLEQGEELRRIARENGLTVGCAPDTFLGGAHQLARAYVDAGKIGRITSGTCHVMGPGMEMWHPNPDFFFLPGGGPVLDLGPYYIADLINLVGPVKRVAALTSMATPTRTITSEPRAGEVIPVRTPTTIHALLKFHSGATITMGASWDVWSHRHAPIELYGTEGSLFLPDPNFFGGMVEASGRNGGITPLKMWDHPFAVDNQVHPEGPRANYRTAGLADMALAILEGRDVRCSLDRALHGVDVMVSILKSGEEGRFIDLSTTCSQPAAFGIAEARALLREDAQAKRKKRAASPKTRPTSKKSRAGEEAAGG